MILSPLSLKKFKGFRSSVSGTRDRNPVFTSYCHTYYDLRYRTVENGKEEGFSVGLIFRFLIIDFS